MCTKIELVSEEQGVNFKTSKFYHSQEKRNLAEFRNWKRKEGTSLQEKNWPPKDRSILSLWETVLLCQKDGADSGMCVAFPIWAQKDFKNKQNKTNQTKTPHKFIRFSELNLRTLKKEVLKPMKALGVHPFVDNSAASVGNFLSHVLSLLDICYIVQ